MRIVQASVAAGRSSFMAPIASLPASANLGLRLCRAALCRGWPARVPASELTEHSRVLGRGDSQATVSQPYARFATCAMGFTLIELLLVLAVIGLLASLLFPALGRAKTTAQSRACLNNLAQLQKGWLMYVHDNDDRFPPNISRKIGFDQFNVIVDGRIPWVLGNAKLDTNTANIKTGVLFNYAESAALFRCPADRSTVRDQHSLLRTRSYSTHEFFNSDIVSGTAADTLNNSEFILTKLSQLGKPGHSSTFVFIDEHRLSIDDGIFGVQIPPGSSPPPGRIWSAIPGDRHDKGANLSFVDGHVESHRWRARRELASHPGGKVFIDPNDTANVEDHQWISQRIPRPQ